MKVGDKIPEILGKDQDGREIKSMVNEEGIIEKIFTPKEIKTKIHAEQILEYIVKFL